MSPQYNPCRRAKAFLHKRDAPNQKRCAGFPCRRHHGCDHCGTLWERERFEWYSQIVAQFDAVHHATAADAAAKNRIRQQRKRRGAYYICVPTGDGFEIFANKPAPATVEVSHGQASTKLDESIKLVPPRGKISGTRALMFSRKKDDETSEWEKDDFQAPLADAPMPAIRDAARQICGNAKLYEFNDRERSYVEFTTPDDWDLADWQRLVALASPDYLDRGGVEIVFTRPRQHTCGANR